jgi:hypothetical protein
LREEKNPTMDSLQQQLKIKPEKTKTKKKYLVNEHFEENTKRVLM